MPLDIDRSLVKVLSFSAATVILAGLFSYRFSLLTESLNLVALWLAVGAAILWMTLFGIQVFVIKSPRLELFLAALNALAVWIFSAQKFSLSALLAFFLLFVFLAVAALRGRMFIDNSLTIKLTQTVVLVTRLALTGLALFLAVYLISFLNFPDLAVSRDVFGFFLSGSDVIVARLIPGFSFDATIDSVLKSFVRSRSAPGTSAATIDRQANELRTALAERFSTLIAPQEKTIDVFYKVMSARLSGLSEYLKILTAAVMVILVFLVVKGLALIANLIIIPLSLLIYRLLTAFNFMHTTLENRSKEIIVVD